MRFINWIKGKFMSISLVLAGCIPFVPQIAYADQFSNAANSAATGIQASAAGATKWLIMIALVIVGICIAFGTQRMRDSAKEHIPWLLIGTALIVGAASFAGIVYGWF